MKDSYARSVKGAQEYHTKAIEFAQANTKAAFDFAQELVGVKSPSEFSGAPPMTSHGGMLAPSVMPFQI